MMDKFKKKKDKLSDVEKEVKGGVLEELRDQASASLSDKIRGLKKVSVASDSPEGLEEGLDKAKELVQEKESEDKMEEQDESEMMMKDPEDCSPEELQEKIDYLMDLKAKKEQGI